MSRPTLLTVLVCAWSVWLTRAALADAPQRAVDRQDRALSSGLALGAGFGSEMPMFGGELLYYQQLSYRLRIAVHVGAGGAPPSVALHAWSVVGGTFLAYGERNRLVVGISGGTQSAWQQFYLHGVRLDSRPTYGAGLSIGWEWMGARGFFLRSTIGPDLYVRRETPLLSRKVYPWFQTALVIGYKLW